MPEIERRRKKPLVVEVLLWDGTNYRQVRNFAWGDKAEIANCRPAQDGGLTVWNNQEQAWFDVPVGHYVVRGALGELYGLSPAAYSDTYEPAAETTGKCDHAEAEDAYAAADGRIAELEAECDRYREALQHVALGTDDRLAALAREALAEADRLAGEDAEASGGGDYKAYADSLFAPVKNEVARLRAQLDDAEGREKAEFLAGAASLDTDFKGDR